MTTFTTEDRIFAEKDGSFTINVEGGTITASPPHIVNSGASIMIKDLTDEEIRDISINFLAPKECNIFTFARAIFKKAKE